jgi:DNA-binding transcriptional regulator YbjK
MSSGHVPAHTASATRHNDPGRRDRIIDACLEVLAEAGVAGTSHRKVAAAAGVPLGSMTYHFAGMQELLHEAFTRFSREMSTRIEQRMSAATDRDAAIGAVISHISVDVFADNRELVLTQELYTLAARDPAYRGITDAWMTRSRHALEQHFDPATARLIDALVEGLTIHRALDPQPQPSSVVAEGIRRLVEAAR